MLVTSYLRVYFTEGLQEDFYIVYKKECRGFYHNNIYFEDVKSFMEYALDYANKHNNTKDLSIQLIEIRELDAYGVHTKAVYSEAKTC